MILNPTGGTSDHALVRSSLCEWCRRTAPGVAPDPREDAVSSIASTAIVLLSIGLRLVGVGYSLVLLSRSRDRRFGFLTLMLSLMALRQILTVRSTSPGIEEVPGLMVSALAILTVHYLSQYIEEERIIKSELQVTNERLRGFRKAIEHAGHAIFLTDSEGTIEYANPAVESVTGYAPDAVIGENPRLWKSGEHDDTFYAEMWDEIASGDVWDGEIINRRKSGELCWVDMTIAPITDESGAVERYVAVETDVTDRKEREIRIQNQNERLDVLNNTNEVLRDVNRELVAASTRDEIERSVCEQFAGSELFDFAWIGDTDLVEGSVRPRSWAGIDADSVESHVETLRDSSPTPIERALTDGVPVFTRFESGASERRKEAAAVVVPLTYRGAEYGVLASVTSRPDALESIDRDVFGELGGTVADTISAVESRRTLASDTVTELEFRLADVDDPLVELAANLGCRVELEHVTTDPDGRQFQYVSVRCDTPEEVSDQAAEFEHVDSVRHVCSHEGKALFRVGVDDTSIVTTLAQYGAGVTSLSADADGGELVAWVSSSNDIRTIVEALRTAYPGLNLIAQRERERDVQSESAFRADLQSALTDRQLEAVRTAYFAGFFEWPRENSGEEVAAMMDISQTTYLQHLRAAEEKVFDALFEETVDDRLEAV